MESPYTKRRNAQFRGPSSSEDFNERIEENFKDLTVLYNRARLNEVELEELYRRAVKDQLSLAREVLDLEDRLDALEKNNASFTFSSGSQIENDRFVEEGEVVEDDLLTFDKTYGFLKLPEVTTSSRSKIVTVDANNIEIIPPSFAYRVEGLAGSADTPASLIDSNDLRYAVYGKPGLIWERNVVSDVPISGGAEMDVYIRLPQELQTSDKSNSIILHTFPYFGTTIKEVSTTGTLDPLLNEADGYTPVNSAGYYDGEADAIGWVAPGGWSGDEIEEAGPRKFYFPERQVTAIKVTLHQPDYYLDGSKYVYSYGLTHVDVRHDKFTQTGRAFIRVDAAKYTTISSIDSVEPEIYNINPALIPDAFSYDVWWETGLDSGTYTQTPVAASSKVWIEVIMTEANSTTPVLSGLRVNYS